MAHPHDILAARAYRLVSATVSPSGPPGPRTAFNPGRTVFAAPSGTAWLEAGLILPLLYLFWPVLSGQRFFFSDAFRDFHYFHYAIHHLIRFASLPLWNPYVHCGEPFYYAHAGQGVFSPVILLLGFAGRAFPPAWIPQLFAGMVLAVSCLLLLGIFRIFTHHGCRPAVAAVGALMLTFSLQRAQGDAFNRIWLAPFAFLAVACLVRWAHTGCRRHLFAAATITMLAASLAIYLLREFFVCLFVFTACLALFLPALRQRCRQHPVILALCGLAILISLLPKLIVLQDSAGSVHHLGTYQPFAVPSLFTIITDSLTFVCFPFDQERLYVNVLVMFLPLALCRKTVRPWFFATMLFWLITVPGRPLLWLVLARLSPSSAPQLYGDIFDEFWILLLLLLGTAGLQVYCDCPPPPPAARRKFGRIARLAYLSALPLCLMLAGLCRFLERADDLYSGTALLAGITLLALSRRWLPAPAAAFPPWLPLAAILVVFVHRFALPAVPPYLTRPGDFRVLPAARSLDAAHGLPTDNPIANWRAAPYIRLRPSADGILWCTTDYADWLRTAPAASYPSLLRINAPWLYTRPSGGAGSPAEPAPAAAETVPAPYVTCRSFTPDRLHLRVTTALPAQLIIADAWHRRWRAVCNSQTIPLRHSSALFKGVDVPPGTSDIILSFRHPFFNAALLVSTVIIFLFGLGACCDIRRRPRAQP